ncbi:DNA polymerase III delta prime subunit [Wigglesworthia glossinidia endosymbiont of Glossina morsitans morsitans (Yale colony)]|uniref:DNA polymerase III subunit delta' n=1 Tax=Wigglesworthia glossinidia endosymbiont of Glossina morsitans morsitans (Yale colony) TaxID=1142511 RepID=H6Q5Q6_WIGGL|nr:DNA polymerase III subunit delta' C-terminal domain-containing protein [Wigglesworthia glossinidia]AFA40961.1 DNA polymerase III delta prime subunit [Wigglesworthia glossinidia endosymbiont of Glossina morsitans morsitans (Yale colony)]
MLYPWLKIPYQEIISCLKFNTSCTVLLQSNSGCGIKKLYCAIIKQIFCKCKKDTIHYNFCLNCQLLSENRHPDLYDFSKYAILNKQIGIDIIREICEKIFYPPYYGDVKIILIQNLELLTNQAMHALLKTIEEPSKKTYFILGCKKINYILPTILSRSKIWNIFIKTSDSLQWLNDQGYTELKKTKIILNLCYGAPIFAKKMLSSNFWEIRKKMILILKKIFLKQASFFHLFESCQKIEIFFIFINSFIIDTIRYKSNIFLNIINIDCIKIVEYMSKICSICFLYQQWDFWLNFKKLNSEISGINKEIFLIKTILAWNNLIQDIK